MIPAPENAPALEGDIEPQPGRPAAGLPAGMVDRDGVCRRFGISRHVWKLWVKKGFVEGGRWVTVPGQRRGLARRKMYSEPELERLQERLQTADMVRRDPLQPGKYLIPDGFVDREGACRMFGVTKTKWDRWTWTGRITCGVHRASLPTIYPVAELERLVAELGRLAPPYPDPERPGCYRVPVHGWALKRKEVLIDAESLPLIENGRLQCPGLGGARTPRDLAYVIFYTSEGGPQDLLHRMVLGITDPELVVAHLNGDPLDCRRANLLVRTKSERGQAARKIKTKNGQPTSSRYKGVTWDQKRGKWAARIQAEGKGQHLGRFNDEIAAAAAYDEAARKYFGEHAYQNFPNGIDAALEAHQRQAA